MKDSKGILILLGGAVIVLLALSLITKKPGQNIFQTFGPQKQNATSSANITPNLKKMTVGKTVVMVAVADNDATRQKGLGGVTNLPIDQGMLFIFKDKQIKPSFWMKDMLIPLDFIWISKGKVAEINTSVPPPPPNTPDNQLAIYAPTVPIDYVLEVNAGFSVTDNIKVDDPVTLP